MKLAFEAFEKDKQAVSEYIFFKILGYSTSEQVMQSIIIPEQIQVPGQPVLDEYQINAVKKALVTPLALIQGPAGTGKTLLATTLVYHLARQRTGKVLVCAPTNIAVDLLALNIGRSNSGLKVVRLCA